VAAKMGEDRTKKVRESKYRTMSKGGKNFKLRQKHQTRLKEVFYRQEGRKKGARETQKKEKKGSARLGDQKKKKMVGGR